MLQCLATPNRAGGKVVEKTEDGLNLSPFYSLASDGPDLDDKERSETDPTELTSSSDDNNIQMEGLVEKRDVDEKWSRYWCRLQDGCLYSYLTPNHQTATGSTDLKGYTVTELIDAIQGKRFVLHLCHKSYVDIFLSLDSRNELEAWQSALQISLASTVKEQRAVDEDGLNGLTRGYQNGGFESRVPRTQEVKQKLLAEMLRQKTELEKMQAARNGMKVWSSLDREQGTTFSTSHGSSDSSLSPRTTSMDDRICALTRLQQRRMSTQIKLQAIRRQLDETSTGGKEKKAVFQIGRKRPDLIQSHDQNQTRQSDLEEQVKSLSSRLQEIDYHLSSHAISSPRDTTETSHSKKGHSLRHSYDVSLQKNSPSTDSNSLSHSLKEINVKKEVQNNQVGNLIKNKEKTYKEKEKDVNRSNSFKSSIQRFAHRTFARANWNRIKKSVTANSNKSDNDHNKNTVENIDCESCLEEERSEKPPDVIDITANHTSANFCEASATSFILAPPDSFKTKESGTSFSKSSDRIKKHRTPKERIWAKLTSSNSFSTWDRLNSRIKTSTSSPNLFAQMKNDQAFLRRCATPQSDSSQVKPPASVPRLNLTIDSDQSDGFVTTPPTDGSGSSAEQEYLTNGFFSDRSSEVVRRRRGGDFLSARNERLANPRKADRYSWACGFSPRKEVNPNALAEIQAFEQLSNKFLGS